MTKKETVTGNENIKLDKPGLIDIEVGTEETVGA
jgi:hypothetical protein